MTEYKELSPAEIYLLNVVYELDGGTAREILARVRKERDWSRNMVLTLLSRLIEKGYLKANKESRRYTYYPNQPKVDAFRRVFRYLFGPSFLNNPFPFISCLFHPDKLTQKDRETILNYLREMEQNEQEEDRE